MAILETADMKCVSYALLAAFDTNGKARDNCRSDASFTECVIYGSIGYKLLARAGEGQEESFDWEIPTASLQAALDTIVHNKGMSCLGWEPSTSGSCFQRELIRSLGLSDAYETICGSEEGEQWEDCVLEAFFMNELQEASLRI